MADEEGGQATGVWAGAELSDGASAANAGGTPLNGGEPVKGGGRLVGGGAWLPPASGLCGVPLAKGADAGELVPLAAHAGTAASAGGGAADCPSG